MAVQAMKVRGCSRVIRLSLRRGGAEGAVGRQRSIGRSRSGEPEHLRGITDSCAVSFHVSGRTQVRCVRQTGRNRGRLRGRWFVWREGVHYCGVRKSECYASPPRTRNPPQTSAACPRPPPPCGCASAAARIGGHSAKEREQRSKDPAARQSSLDHQTMVRPCRTWFKASSGPMFASLESLGSL